MLLFLFFGSTHLTWKPLRATNSRRMSLVPSKIRNILRSLITLSTPASCRSTTQEVHSPHWKTGCKTRQANKPGAARAEKRHFHPGGYYEMMPLLHSPPPPFLPLRGQHPAVTFPNNLSKQQKVKKSAGPPASSSNVVFVCLEWLLHRFIVKLHTELHHWLHSAPTSVKKSAICTPAASDVPRLSRGARLRDEQQVLTPPLPTTTTTKLITIVQ